MTAVSRLPLVQQHRLFVLARRYRLGAAVGLMVAGMAVLAAQALGDNDGLLADTAVADLRSLLAMTAGSVAGAPDQTPVSLSAQLPAHDATIGRLAGEGATSGGAASYRIPIVVPPGRRGMQPELALTYSSRAGNGIAGMGWSLSATSEITRCPATLDQDGSVAAVKLTTADKLCMDGQRLVATGGIYGQSGATYDTELQSFSRVTQLGGALNAATTYFKVEAKDGDISYYGGSSTAASAARVIPGGTTLPSSWLIERRQDRVGNLMRYAYANFGNGESLLSSILYTGFGASDGTRHVDFSYETRPSTAGSNDIASSYLAGVVTLQTQRLKQISTYVGTQAVRKYVLRYDSVSRYSGRSLLRGIQDCGFATGSTTPVCHPETVLAWQEGTLQSQLHHFVAAGLPTGQEMEWMRPLGDIDGDGVSEMLAHYLDPTHQTSGTSYLLSLNADRTVRGVVNTSTLSGSFSPPRHPVDFNKDGRADAVGFTSTGLSVTIWNNSTTAWGASSFTTYQLPLNLSGTICFGSNDGYPLVGDFNGDGFTDLAVATSASGGCAKVPGNSAWTLSVYLGKAGATPGVPAINPTAVLTRALPYVTQTDGAKANYYPSEVSDFDGDGLLDITLTHEPMPMSGGAPQQLLHDQMLWFSRTTAGVYSLGGSGNELNSFAAMASPALEADETDVDAFTRIADVNGDGLEDLISIKSLNGAGYWSVRLNTGGRWGPRTITNNRRGIETCKASAWKSCADRWTPLFASLLSVADTDNDGRAEILAPRAFALRMCSDQTELSYSEPVDTYFCPENPLTGAMDPAPAGMDGHYRGFYTGSPLVPIDGSAYYMDAVRFTQGNTGALSAITINTPIVNSGAQQGYLNHTLTSDLYGDGLEDYLGPIGVPIPPDTDGRYPYYSTFAMVAADPTWGPATLPDGTAAGSFDNKWQFYIAENPGVSSTRNPDGATPQTPDMLAMVTDGLGVQTAWTYYPLSSKAGRAASDTPLYSVPGALASRYVDDRHFYFSSSMSVVSDMMKSDGVGGYRSWRYGYSEAMYQARGRGFQGFRNIIEEDEAAGTRTTTTFNQKFPLTGQPAQIIVNSLNRSGTAAPLSTQIYTWRCNRANRADATACVPPSGNATLRFPFLDMQETWTYDAVTADNPSGGTPALVTYRQEVAADDSTCAGGLAGTSGYDAYGNLTASTVLTSDGNGTGGYRQFVSSNCLRTRTSFAPADVTNWWLDKVNTRQVTMAIAYNATNHPLPAGVANPAQTVTTTYTWNSDRTAATETVQSGIANQQRVTTYGYPTTNYGLPQSVSVAASGDPNGSRTVSTTASADGYFPLTVSNPLLQTVTTVTRAADGQPSQVTDVNGLRTILQYDAFGFNTLTQYRGVTDGEYVAPDKARSISWCATCNSPVPTKLVRLATVQDGTRTQYVNSDQFGRPVYVNVRVMDGSWTSVQTHFDAAGHKILETKPYRNATTVYSTVYSGFDILGRPTQKTTPTTHQDSRGDMVTTYSYSGRQTSIRVCGSTDGVGTTCPSMSRTTDSLGRYQETVDANSGVTQYWYDGSGKAIAIQDAKGSVISAAYNAIGQRTSVADPNQGSWTFWYDALGEVLSQTDARGITTSSAYDPLGRPIQRSAKYDYDGSGPVDTVVDSWTYDPANAKGQEGSNQRVVNTTTLRQEATSYDALARPIARTVTQLRAGNASTDAVTQQTSYDVYYGRPKAQDYGNGEIVWLQYGTYGELASEDDLVNGGNFHSVAAVDAYDSPTTETLSNQNITITRSYEPQTGQMASVQLGNVANANLRRLDYAYDVFGNLLQAALNTNQASELYSYDALQRLTRASRTGTATATTNYQYDAVGNFASKSDFSIASRVAYSYAGGTCGGGPNAVKSIQLPTSARTYCYDADGNMTSDSAGLSLTYDHTQRPLKVVRGAIQSSFDYAPSGERFRQLGTDGEVQYFGAVERRYPSGASDKTYVGATTLISKIGSNRTVSYLLTDRLGSVDAVADANGNLVETRGFDAFGKPRNGDWSDATPPRLGTTTNTTHGFTGQEHLDQLELIHMNGRVYDYNVGRFTGVDPVIQFPLNSQSLNPYSYILNNPLAATDPTGYAMDCSKVMGPFKGECESSNAATDGTQDKIGFAAILQSLGLTTGGLPAGVMAGLNGAHGMDAMDGNIDQLGASSTRGNKNSTSGSLTSDNANLQSAATQSSDENAGADWGVQDTAYKNQIAATFDPFTTIWTIAGRLTVDGVAAGRVVDQLNSGYANVEKSQNGLNIRLAITFSKVQAGGDVHVEWFDHQDIQELESSHNWPAGGRMEFGSRTLELSQEYWQVNSDTAIHEMGHGFGLHHAPGLSNSTMSWNMLNSRKWQFHDFENLKKQFQVSPQFGQ